MWGLLDWHMPRISLHVPPRVLAILQGRMVRAMLITLSKVMLPLCLMFLTFFQFVWGLLDLHMPRISLHVPPRVLAILRGGMVRAMLITLSKVMLPLCLMFLTFFQFVWGLLDLHMPRISLHVPPRVLAILRGGMVRAMLITLSKVMLWHGGTQS